LSFFLKHTNQSCQTKSSDNFRYCTGFTNKKSRPEKKIYCDECNIPMIIWFCKKINLRHDKEIEMCGTMPRNRMYQKSILPLSFSFICYFVCRGWLFFIRLVCRRIEPAYCIAIVFIVLNMCFMEVSQRLNFVSSIFIEGACIVLLAPVVMTMSGSTFQPCWMTLLISGWYFSILLRITSGENLSLV